jgi:hypothetical protein
MAPVSAVWGVLAEVCPAVVEAGGWLPSGVGSVLMGVEGRRWDLRTEGEGESEELRGLLIVDC